MWRLRILNWDIWSLSFQMEKYEKDFRGQKSTGRVMHIGKGPV